jgi:hypothetical protein
LGIWSQQPSGVSKFKQMRKEWPQGWPSPPTDMEWVRNVAATTDVVSTSTWGSQELGFPTARGRCCRHGRRGKKKEPFGAEMEFGVSMWTYRWTHTHTFPSPVHWTDLQTAIP